MKGYKPTPRGYSFISVWSGWVSRRKLKKRKDCFSNMQGQWDLEGKKYLVDRDAIVSEGDGIALPENQQTNILQKLKLFGVRHKKFIVRDSVKRTKKKVRIEDPISKINLDLDGNLIVVRGAARDHWLQKEFVSIGGCWNTKKGKWTFPNEKGVRENLDSIFNNEQLCEDLQVGVADLPSKFGKDNRGSGHCLGGGPQIFWSGPKSEE